MKNTDLFKALNGIDPRYLEEAENYKAEKKRSPAVILKILLPVAALICLTTVLFTLILPQKAPSDLPTDPIDPLSEAKSEVPAEMVKDELVYKNYSDHAEITGYLGDDEKVVVPASVGGLPITVINLPQLNADALSEISVQSENLESLIVCEEAKISLTIGADVKNIDYSVLHSKNVESITVDPDNKDFSSFCGMLYTKDCKTLIACPAGLSATRISFHPENETANVGDDTLLLAAQLTRVRASAFKNCSVIRSIAFPDKLTTIETSSLSDCTALCSLSLPGNIRSIPYDCFAGCTLKELEFRGNREEFEKLNLSLPENIRLLFAIEDVKDAELTGRIIEAFVKAEEAYSWFTPYNQIDCDTEEETDGFCKVVYPGLSSMDDLRSRLLSSFDEKVVSKLLSSEKETFRDGENGLLVCVKQVVCYYDSSERSYTVTSDGNDGYYLVIRSTVPGLPYDLHVDSSCRLKITEDGQILFADPFTLPAEAWYGLYLIETAK